MTADGKGLPKYARVAAAVRGQVADGTLRPGQPAPSGAALSRATGYSTLTCRRALRVLIADGVLTPGPSRNARPRVAGPPQPPAERDLASAARALAAGLATRRRANGLTQPELAGRVDVSVTTIGHAETGRLWQSRQFWERADAALGAGEGLLRLHDAYREASASSAAETASHPETGETVGPQEPAGNGGAVDDRPDDPGGAFPWQAARVGLAAGQWPGQWPGQRPGGRPLEREGAEAGATVPGHAVSGAAAHDQAPACVMIVWGDGTVTTVRPPEAAPPEISQRERPPG
jgi:transcriptional regulator with XRE-family HTH domain